jgi:hypothetical protein
MFKNLLFTALYSKILVFGYIFVPSPFLKRQIFDSSESKVVK